MTRRHVLMGAAAFGMSATYSDPCRGPGLSEPEHSSGRALHPRWIDRHPGARLLGQRLEVALKYPVIIESRPGAGGSVGVGSVARAAADGHTLVMGHIGTLAVNPALYPKLPYDPMTSFEPSAASRTCTTCSSSIRRCRQRRFRNSSIYAKQNPGKLNYASGGVGGALTSPWWPLPIGRATTTHVPYRGTVLRP